MTHEAYHHSPNAPPPPRFRREALPDPGNYYAAAGIALKGSGRWKTARCPFGTHDDKTPSFRVHAESGAFCCHACGAKGGDVLAFHRARYGVDFKTAATDLGAYQ